MSSCEGYGNWYLEASKATEVKNYPVDLYMISQNAPQAYKDEVKKATGTSEEKRAIYEKYCIKASVTVKAGNKDTTKNKVVVTNKGSNNWNVADTDYVANTAGWTKYTPVSFKSNLGLAENKEITVAATVNNEVPDYVTFNLSNPKYLTYETVTVPGGTQKCIVLPAEGAKDSDVKTNLSADFTKKLQSDIETYTKGLKDANRRNLDKESTIVWINDKVKSYISNEINKAIKGAADDGETPTPPATPAVQIATEWTVTVRAAGAAEGTEPLYDETFTIAEPVAVNAVNTAITALKLGADENTIVGQGEDAFPVTATTTAAQFAAAVRKALGTSVTRNISITAEIVGETKVPVVGTKSSITFKLKIRDLSKAPGEEGYSGEIDNIVFTLPALDSLLDCANKVSTGLTSQVLTEIVKNAWITVHTTDDAFYTEVKNQLVTKAKTLITNNPNVTVDGFVKNEDKTDDFTFKKPESAADSAKTISCKLHLTDTETKETEDNKANFVVELKDVTISAIAEFQTPAELATAALSIKKIAYVGTQDAALTAIKAEVEKLSVNPKYSKSTITVTASTAEGSTTKFEPPTQEKGGSITNVVVKTGEGQGESTTLSEVTIEKQQTTPAPAPEG